MLIYVTKIEPKYDGDIHVYQIYIETSAGPGRYPTSCQSMSHVFTFINGYEAGARASDNEVTFLRILDNTCQTEVNIARNKEAEEGGSTYRKWSNHDGR